MIPSPKNAIVRTFQHLADAAELLVACFEVPVKVAKAFFPSLRAPLAIRFQHNGVFLASQA